MLEGGWGRNCEEKEKLAYCLGFRISGLRGKNMGATVGLSRRFICDSYGAPLPDSAETLVEFGKVSAVMFHLLLLQRIQLKVQF